MRHHWFTQKSSFKEQHTFYLKNKKPPFAISDTVWCLSGPSELLHSVRLISQFSLLLCSEQEHLECLSCHISSFTVIYYYRFIFLLLNIYWFSHLNRTDSVANYTLSSPVVVVCTSYEAVNPSQVRAPHPLGTAECPVAGDFEWPTESMMEDTTELTVNRCAVFQVWIDINQSINQSISINQFI